MLDIKRRCFFQNSLHLCAVLAHDADIVSSCLVCPVLLYIKRTELSKSVRGEKYLIGAVVGHYDLGPMHHRRGDKIQRMFAKRQR